MRNFYLYFLLWNQSYEKIIFFRTIFPLHSIFRFQREPKRINRGQISFSFLDQKNVNLIEVYPYLKNVYLTTIFSIFKCYMNWNV